MLIDLIASFIISGMFPSSISLWVWALYWPLVFGYWVYSLVRLGKKESKGGMWGILLLGVFVSFFFASIASMFISNDKIDTERERRKLVQYREIKAFFKD
ncbi:MAG: hypothetical protein GBAus27B_000581 [Mycoplasmataceae bacterium]|nr:MAG: hypothetical protein GBAus27B_000001 [Mycoplasmataceae bacterium]WNE40514.1 MAG: hypothetical protein GBAus27B_000581 [Mycoplasmataceae bacterium]